MSEKLFEHVIERVDSGDEWSYADPLVKEKGIVTDELSGNYPHSFFEIYINSEHFHPGDKLRIIVEKVEGEG